MSLGYHSSIKNFLLADKDKILGALVTSVTSTGIQSQHARQINAWQSQIDLLHIQLKQLVQAFGQSAEWYIVLEYEIPRRSKRPDVVILAGDILLITEFKIGAITYDSSSKWQVEDYAFNFRDFHAESSDRLIIPILCSTEAPTFATAIQAEKCHVNVLDVRFSNKDNYAHQLLDAYHGSHDRNAKSIDPKAWLYSSYRPTLTIIEAAENLYGNHGVREISHNYAANLDLTTDMLAREIIAAKQENKYSICFITGVPGAGKTLTGLNVVHDPKIRSDGDPAGIFLSGNGPLVKIVREALVQNQMQAGLKRQECTHQVSTFIQNIHQFLKYHREHSSSIPHEHIVVFDEAQRAWNSEQMSKKQDVDLSESALLLNVMERFNDWAVVVALVGGGQEIHLGEAGLQEWGKAITSSKKKWEIIASPETIHGGPSVAGNRLFEGAIPHQLSFRSEPLAHLNVSVRSHRAQQIAEWVNAILALDADSAKDKLPDMREFPIIRTRSLAAARLWLRSRTQLEPEKRCGLITTSQDRRLRAYGLETSAAFRGDYSFDKWFLAKHDDVRSSFALEVAASEFECQGLELDYVGLCWGGDLSPDDNHADWIYRRFRGKAWQFCRTDEMQSFIRNRYRVLLTRARYGMVIWTPPGSIDDITLDSQFYDNIYGFLESAGVPELDETTM